MEHIEEHILGLDVDNLDLSDYFGSAKGHEYPVL